MSPHQNEWMMSVANLFDHQNPCSWSISNACSKEITPNYSKLLTEENKSNALPEMASCIASSLLRRNKRFFVSAILSLISILISPVLSTDAMWNVISAETGTGTAAALETSMANRCWYPQLASLKAGQTYVFSSTTGQPSTNVTFEGTFLMRWTNQSPIRLGTADAWGLRSIRSVVLTEAKTMYAGGIQRFNPIWHMQIHTMAYNTGTGLYSQTDWFTNSGFNFSISKLVLEEIGAPPTTSYLYYLKSSVPYSLNRLDVTIPVTSGSAVSPLTSPTGALNHYNSPSTQLRLGRLFVWGLNSTNMQFVDKTAMTITTTLTGSLICNLFTIDNTNIDLVFATRSDSPYGLYRIPIPTAGTYTSTHSFSTTSTIDSNILNFGPYQYIGLVRTDATPKVFQMYLKADLSVASIPDLVTDNSGMELITLVQGPSEGNKFFLAYQLTTAGYNFQSYYIQFDLCTSRAGGQHSGGICPSCPTGYYLSEVSVANNQCYPDGWQITNGILTVLVPCADTNCLECPTSSTVCRKCKQTPTQYWSQGTDPTTCVTTAPASRFGIDSTGFKYVACSDA